MDVPDWLSTVKLGGLTPKENRDPHSSGIDPLKVVVGGVHVVLRCSRWVPVYQEPGLVCSFRSSVGTRLIRQLRDASNNQPVPCGGTRRIRGRAAMDVTLDRKEGDRTSG